VPDADLVFQFIMQVFVPPVITVGALVAVLWSIFMVYLTILDYFEMLPKGGQIQ
jgi:hypothetical protein